MTNQELAERLAKAACKDLVERFREMLDAAIPEGARPGEARPRLSIGDLEQQFTEQCRSMFSVHTAPAVLEALNPIIRFVCAKLAEMRYAFEEGRLCP